MSIVLKLRNRCAAFFLSLAAHLQTPKPSPLPQARRKRSKNEAHEYMVLATIDPSARCRAICPYDTVSCCCRLTTRRRDVVLFISWLSPISMMQNLQKNLPKLGFWSFFTFFRRKPPSGHGLSWHTKFNPILLVVSEEIGVRQTDGQTDAILKPTSFWYAARRTNPFGVWLFMILNI